jgi:hypothetical protein
MAALERTLEGVRKGTGIEAVRAEANGGDGEGLDDLSRDELAERAKQAGVKGRSKMSKKELIAALEED